MQLRWRDGGARLLRTQNFDAPRTALSDPTSTTVALRPFASCQAGRMVGRKSWCLSHPFSKQKTFGFGMEVERDKRIGVWSEVGFGREVSDELGKAGGHGGVEENSVQSS